MFDELKRKNILSQIIIDFKNATDNLNRPLNLIKA